MEEDNESVIENIHTVVKRVKIDRAILEVTAQLGYFTKIIDTINNLNSPNKEKQLLKIQHKVDRSLYEMDFACMNIASKEEEEEEEEISEQIQKAHEAYGKKDLLTAAQIGYEVGIKLMTLSSRKTKKATKEIVEASRRMINEEQQLIIKKLEEAMNEGQDSSHSDTFERSNDYFQSHKATILTDYFPGRINVLVPDKLFSEDCNEDDDIESEIQRAIAFMVLTMLIENENAD